MGVWRRWLAGLAGLGLGCGAPPADNAVLVTIDTLRADHVGAYGGVVPTPTLDALAAEGALLTGACTPTPTTAPAHASLLSGLHPWHHRVVQNAGSYDAAAAPNLAARLEAAGLRTAAFVSSFVLDARWGFAHGFETFAFEPGTDEFGVRLDFARGGKTVDAALRWLETLAEGERFFLWVHLFDPHEPYAPPRRFWKAAPRPTGVDDDLARRIRAYRGEVAYADAQVGRLVEALRSAGLLEATAVVVTSDHGEGLGDHGLLGHGYNLFAELVRVPLIFRAPGVPAGRRLEGPAQLEDLMPTLSSLLGLRAPEEIDGVDLAPWLRGEVEASPRRAVVGRRRTYAREPVLFFERRWPHKWIGELDGRGRRYRLDVDPGETAGSPAPGAPEALRAADARLAKPRPVPLDAETRRSLEALGYTDHP